VKRLEQLCQLKTTTVVELARNDARQRSRRQLEHEVRANIVNFSLSESVQHFTLPDLAALLQLSPHTLRQWQASYVCARLRPCALGRPLLRASAHERNQVIDVLGELGPRTGLPTLQECFPDLARAELHDILSRYRRLWRKLHLQTVHYLRWPVPGRVWAMDFSDPPRPIDGLYPHLLAVRDLPSGAQLLWLPVSNMTSIVAQQALASLCACLGAPLVLKIDNGSAFIDAAFLALLAQQGIIPLFSPPRLPQYNGSAEAGIGSLATRTEQQAVLQGHPGHWTCQDAATAREQANATSRPRGPNQPTAGHLWQARTPITPEERSRFQDTVARRRLQARRETGKTIEEQLTTRELRSLDRQAIRRALVEHDYLVFRRRRIPLPINKQKVTNII
jgi:transposase InsO family protein